MAEQILSGRRVLVVEDEYLLADDLAEELAGAGAEVLGPYPTVADASALIASGERIDAALLDINVRGETIFAVADALEQRGIPFAFTTGYDRYSLPERFAETLRLEKPLNVQRVAARLVPLLV